MPTSIGLNESHQRRLLANAQYADRLLGDIESILSAAESKSAFPKYRPDISLHQARQLRSQMARFRDHLCRVLDAVGVRRETAQFGSLHSIKVTLTFVRIAVQEMAPEYLRGYGELSDEALSQIRGLCTELESLINGMERNLALGEAVDLQARLERLQQTPGESGLLRLLDRVTNEHELAEFRAPLLNLVDRLESPHFEIAVFGRVSSGKSSLLNRLLGTEVLPVGVNPITAVPTRIVFNKEPSLTVTFVDRQTQRHPIEDLSRYASEEHNAGNELGVIRLVVALPSSRLRNGLVLVDTPGLGALAVAGAAETLSYLPQCDLGIILISAASPINDEDLNTIQALTQAAIPVMVLLSKADLLSEQDRQKAAEYSRKEVLNHLGLTVGVHAVSTFPQSSDLLEEWFRDELAPLFDRQQELAKLSVRRKAGAMREAVIKALHAKLGSANGQIPSSALEEAERSLRTAAGLIEEARRGCIDHTDGMRNLHEAAMQAAVSSLAEERNIPGADLAATLVRNAAESTAAEGAEGLARRLSELAGRLQEALSTAEQALHTDRLPPDDYLKGCVREIPRFELALPEIPLSPQWLPASGMLGRAWLSGRLKRSLDPNLRTAFTNFSRALAVWSTGVLAELQRRFDEKADVYRAQLGRLMKQKRLSGDAQERTERDLAELEGWTGASQDA